MCVIIVFCVCLCPFAVTTVDLDDKKMDILSQINLLGLCAHVCVCMSVLCFDVCLNASVYMHRHVKEGFFRNTEIGQVELYVYVCVCVACGGGGLGRCVQCKQALNIKSRCNTNKNDIFLFSS